jgi:hypothetical protein
MKKIILPLIVICLLLINCKSQKHNHNLLNKKNETNKKLDEKIIKSLLPLMGGKIINDTLFSLDQDYAINGIETYVYIARPINKNFRKISVYYKKTLTLKTEGNLFVSMPIGIYKFYDEKGKLIKEIDYEKGFENFTVNDLLLKVKKEFKIDLNDKINELSVSREIGKEDKIPIYVVRIPVTIDSRIKIRFIGINGITGNITYDRVFEDVQWGDD